MAGVDINQVFPQAMVKEGDRDLLVSSTTLYMLLGTVHPYAYQVGEESEAIKHQGHALNLHASESLPQTARTTHCDKEHSYFLFKAQIQSKGG